MSNCFSRRVINILNVRQPLQSDVRSGRNSRIRIKTVNSIYSFFPMKSSKDIISYNFTVSVVYIYHHKVCLPRHVRHELITE